MFVCESCLKELADNYESPDYVDVCMDCVNEFADEGNDYEGLGDCWD
jgi:hypothetical protein